MQNSSQNFFIQEIRPVDEMSRIKSPGFTNNPVLANTIAIDGFDHGFWKSVLFTDIGLVNRAKV